MEDYQLAFSRIRNCYDEDILFQFFGKFVPAVAGRKIWKPEAMQSRNISDPSLVSTTDEAFTVLCLENYWEKWNHESYGQCRWTETRRGNKRFSGWHENAYTRFSELCKDIAADRADSDRNNHLETRFRNKAVAFFRGKGGKRKRRQKDVCHETYDELDVVVDAGVLTAV